MTDQPDEDSVESRSELLPEEQAAGSENPHDQAQQILEESEERTEAPGRTGEDSTQTSTPDQRPGVEGD